MEHEVCVMLWEVLQGPAVGVGVWHETCVPTGFPVLGMVLKQCSYFQHWYTVHWMVERGLEFFFFIFEVLMLRLTIFSPPPPPSPCQFYYYYSFLLLLQFRVFRHILVPSCILCFFLFFLTRCTYVYSSCLWALAPRLSCFIFGVLIIVMCMIVVCVVILFQLFLSGSTVIYFMLDSLCVIFIMS